ncbi:MAG: hypothetical protein B7X11_03890, partial [Acidobacteria bacterium 37-65-4]
MVARRGGGPRLGPAGRLRASGLRVRRCSPHGGGLPANPMSGGLLLRDRRATRALALQVGRRLTGAELLLLTGELGAGKTTFVRYLTQALGLDPAWVSSPSFTLLQRYPPGPGGFGITHVDLYR